MKRTLQFLWGLVCGLVCLVGLMSLGDFPQGGWEGFGAVTGWTLAMYMWVANASYFVMQPSKRTERHRWHVGVSSWIGGLMYLGLVLFLWTLAPAWVLAGLVFGFWCAVVWAKEQKDT